MLCKVHLLHCYGLSDLFECYYTATQPVLHTSMSTLISSLEVNLLHNTVTQRLIQLWQYECLLYLLESYHTATILGCFTCAACTTVPIEIFIWSHYPIFKALTMLIQLPSPGAQFEAEVAAFTKASTDHCLCIYWHAVYLFTFSHLWIQIYSYTHWFQDYT